MRAPERTNHARRLRILADEFREQERFMSQALKDVQLRLDNRHREAGFHRSLPGVDPEESFERGSELQQERDALTAELAHVRMAIHGAGDELASACGVRLGA